MMTIKLLLGFGVIIILVLSSCGVLLPSHQEFLVTATNSESLSSITEEYPTACKAKKVNLYERSDGVRVVKLGECEGSMEESNTN